MENPEILSGASATLVTIIIAILSIAKSVFSEFFASNLGQRVLPIIPIILGMFGGLLGLTAAATLKAQLISGFLTGISASFLFKVGKTTVLGQGIVEGEVVKKTKKLVKKEE